MSGINAGGTAFPRPTSFAAAGNLGMSLRDYFAGQVLVAALHQELMVGSDKFRFDLRAKFAYKMADAILAERGTTDE